MSREGRGDTEDPFEGRTLTASPRLHLERREDSTKTLSRYNGFLPQGDRGRRRSKFVLGKRSEHNGVKRSRHYVVQSPETSHAILDATQHSISYTLSRNQAVIVEYQEDEHTDMFQVSQSFFPSDQRLQSLTPTLILGRPIFRISHRLRRDGHPAW